MIDSFFFFGKIAKTYCLTLKLIIAVRVQRVRLVRLECWCYVRLRFFGSRDPTEEPETITCRDTIPDQRSLLFVIDSTAVFLLIRDNTEPKHICTRLSNSLPTDMSESDQLNIVHNSRPNIRIFANMSTQYILKRTNGRLIILVLSENTQNLR